MNHHRSKEWMSYLDAMRGDESLPQVQRDRALAVWTRALLVLADALAAKVMTLRADQNSWPKEEEVYEAMVAYRAARIGVPPGVYEVVTRPISTAGLPDSPLFPKLGIGVGAVAGAVDALRAAPTTSFNSPMRGYCPKCGNGWMLMPDQDPNESWECSCGHTLPDPKPLCIHARAAPAEGGGFRCPDCQLLFMVPSPKTESKCASCGASPLYTERGRCEDCGACPSCVQGATCGACDDYERG